MSEAVVEPPSSLVVECPGCRAAIAVRGDLTYRAARCPLCAAEFLIPKPRRGGLTHPPAAQMGGPAAGTAPQPTLVAEPPSWETESPSFSLPEPPEEPPPALRPPGELEFREPEKTIATPEGTLRLRRLSPEERQARRTRRNVIMLCGGATILFLIVFLLRDKKRR